MSLRIDGLGWIRSFARPDITMAGAVVRIVGAAGAILLVVKMAEWIRDWGKPSLASVFAKPYRGQKTHEKLQKVLNNARGDISFWGTRHICADGYKGMLEIERVWWYLDLLAGCDCRLSHEGPSGRFNLEQVRIGKELEDRINQLDKDADAQLRHKWFVTKACILFRERNPLGHARYIGEYSGDHGLPTYHEWYTKEAYVARFGVEPDRPADKRSWGRPDVDMWQASRRFTEGKQGEGV